MKKLRKPAHPRRAVLLYETNAESKCCQIW